MKKRTSPAYLNLARQIKDAVLQGEFKPGVRLKIDELAVKYRTSATPVRQALQALQDQGLVEAHMNRGATVRVVERKTAGHLYEMRRAILAIIVANCTERASPRDLEKLEALAREALAETRLFPSQEAQRAFFAHIAVVGGNPFAAETLERHWPMLVAVREYYGFGLVAAADQRPLAGAIAKGQVERAVQIAQDDCDQAETEVTAQGVKDHAAEPIALAADIPSLQSLKPQSAPPEI